MTFFQVIAAVLVAWCSGALFGLGLLGWPSGRSPASDRKRAPASAPFDFGVEPGLASPVAGSGPAPAPSRVISAAAFKGLDQRVRAWPWTKASPTPAALSPTKRESASGKAGRKRRPWRGALRTVLEIALVLSIALGAVWAVGYFTIHGRPAAVAKTGR